MMSMCVLQKISFSVKLLIGLENGLLLFWKLIPPSQEKSPLEKITPTKFLFTFQFLTKILSGGLNSLPPPSFLIQAQLEANRGVAASIIKTRPKIYNILQKFR